MTGLPRSFAGNGFVTPDKLRKRRRIMIGTDGPSDSGKTEFILSAPGPGVVLCLDRGIDKVIDNPNPPEQRGEFGFKIIEVPLVTQGPDANFYKTYWGNFYADYRNALGMEEVRTLGIDGDSDGWELQRLAAFGKLTQVPPIMYTEVNAARRAMYARAHDSCKIIIATNKVKGEYVEDEKDKSRRVATGEYVRQGFGDQDYLFNLQLRHKYTPARVNKVTGKVMAGYFSIKIMKCGANSELIGEELSGKDCNFAGLMQLVYPQIELTEWGFPE